MVKGLRLSSRVEVKTYFEPFDSLRNLRGLFRRRLFIYDSNLQITKRKWFTAYTYCFMSNASIGTAFFIPDPGDASQRAEKPKMWSRIDYVERYNKTEKDLVVSATNDSLQILDSNKLFYNDACLNTLDDLDKYIDCDKECSPYHTGYMLNYYARNDDQWHTCSQVSHIAYVSLSGCVGWIFVDPIYLYRLSSIADEGLQIIRNAFSKYRLVAFVEAMSKNLYIDDEPKNSGTFDIFSEGGLW